MYTVRRFITVILSIAEFVLCVLGKGGGESEGVKSDRGEEVEKRGLRDLIIQRIDHPSDDVCCYGLPQSAPVIERTSAQLFFFEISRLP